MPMKPKTDFNDLKEYWYKKLHKSGFKDAEDTYENLINHDSFKWMYVDPLDFNAQRRYFELADQLKYTYVFRSVLQETIWNLHCQGKSIRTIANEVCKSKTYVFNAVEELSSLIKVAK